MRAESLTKFVSLAVFSACAFTASAADYLPDTKLRRSQFQTNRTEVVMKACIAMLPNYIIVGEVPERCSRQEVSQQQLEDWNAFLKASKITGKVLDRFFSERPSEAFDLEALKLFVQKHTFLNKGQIKKLTSIDDEIDLAQKKIEMLREERKGVAATMVSPN